jgi:hypothetical protein
MSDFSIDIGALKRRPKPGSDTTVAKTDRVAEAKGFVPREPQGRRGRPKSPRTGQVHAKVMPEVAAQISAEARRQGVQQGVLIEQAWQLYLEHRRRGA